jgi:ribonuclease HII
MLKLFEVSYASVLAASTRDRRLNSFAGGESIECGPTG